MSTLFDYRLEDFILFSHAIYYDFVAHYNAQIWPLHLLILITLLSLLVLIGRQKHKDIASYTLIVFLSLCLLFIAKIYFLDNYQTINWSATYMAYGFVLQAVLMMGYVLFRQINNTEHSDIISKTEKTKSTYYFLFFVIFGLPLSEFFSLPRVFTLSVAGVDPDSTMMIILGTVLLYRLPWFFALLPCLWLAISTAIHYALDAKEYLFSSAVLVIFSYIFIKMHWKTLLKRWQPIG